MTPPIPDNFFNNSLQSEWNQKRLTKIYEIFGKEWFEGKRVLEVACGRGFFGRELVKVGATVQFTDAREMFVSTLKADGFTALQMDQDKVWTVPANFDLVIHFGVLYHLDDWKQDLRCAIATAPQTILETEASDKLDPTYEIKLEEIDHYDQAFNRKASRFSDTHVEAYLKELGVNFKRYDDTDIDCGCFLYSWKHGQQRGNELTRRMWLIWR